ncbi:MAG: DUF2807 domain-containing protein [Bacteroidia bacterium]|nr:DUF2807 domain-containing protein [Bacteroidia bacterium]
MRQLLVCLLLPFFLSNCNKDNAFDCFKSNGKTTSQVRFPGYFNRIQVNDKIEVTIHKGNEYKVEVMAGANLLRKIKTKVVDNELIIDNNNKCNFVRGYKHQIKAHITLPYLKMAVNSGVGDMHIEDNFTQDTLVVRVDGVGDIYVNGTFNQVRSSTHGAGNTYVSGTTDSFAIYASGTCYVWAKDLNVKGYLFVNSLSLGDIYVNCNGLSTMDYTLESDGNLYYSGKPGVLNNYSLSTAKGVAKRID